MKLQELASRIYLNKSKFSPHIGRHASWFNKANENDVLLICGFYGLMNDVTIIAQSLETKSFDLLYTRMKIIGLFPAKIILKTLDFNTREIPYVIKKIDEGKGVEKLQTELIMICNNILIWLYERS